MNRKKITIILLLVAFIFFILLLLQMRVIPEKIQYGVSFNEFRANRLNLNPKEVFDASVDDLGIRYFRLSSHWPIIEPNNNQYNFEFLDYQIDRLEEVGGSAILTLGRRQPGWPECHEPWWYKDLAENEKQKQLFEFIETVVNRYKDSPAVEYWQVENEPYLTSFAFDHCGDLDEEMLLGEIEFVKFLDKDREVVVTDSGNIGNWFGAYKNGDVFGTSLYRYFWTPDLGIFKSRLPAAFYRMKYNVVRTIYGKKPAFLIELAAEPWLPKPILEASLEEQLPRMSIKMIDDSIDFASETGFDRQYLWGVEWWYWLKTEKDTPQYWDYAKNLYK